jgi:hypothetical protein
MQKYKQYRLAAALLLLIAGLTACGGGKSVGQLTREAEALAKEIAALDITKPANAAKAAKLMAQAEKLAAELEKAESRAAVELPAQAEKPAAELAKAAAKAEAKAESAEKARRSKVKRIADLTKIEAYLAQYTGDAKAGQTGGDAAGTPDLADLPDLALNVPLTAENWRGILNALENAGVQVRLDLSDCKRGTQTEGGGLRSDGVFDPNTGTDDAAGYGIKYIAELVLPRAAAALADGPVAKHIPQNLNPKTLSDLEAWSNLNSSAVSDEDQTGTFRNFDNLQAVSGENITNTGRFTFVYEHSKLQTARFPKAAVIGDGAFGGCAALTSASFPAATNIGMMAFGGAALTSVSFPAATDIDMAAFAGCAALTSVSFPAATDIGMAAFGECAALTSASFPAATNIGMMAFGGAALTSVSFPAATAIGSMAFVGAALTSVSFPKATAIGAMAFASCAALTSVSFPAATDIGEGAFLECAALTSVSFPAVTAVGK